VNVVAEQGRYPGGGAADEILPDDHHRDPRGAEVFLGPRVEDAEFGYFQGFRKDAAGYIRRQGDGTGIGDLRPFGSHNGIVQGDMVIGVSRFRFRRRGDVRVGPVFGTCPGKDFRVFRRFFRGLFCPDAGFNIGGLLF
jgi:hypothetical protein